MIVYQIDLEYGSGFYGPIGYTLAETGEYVDGPMFFTQGDTNAHAIEISLTNGEQPADLSGHLVSVTEKFSDGRTRERILPRKEGSANTVLWALSKEDLAVPGEVTATVHLYGADDSLLSYPDFVFMVKAAARIDDVVQSSTSFDLYINARHCGSYSGDTRYYMNNIVEYAGASYMALRDTQGNPPPAPPLLSNEYWHLLSQRGNTGWKGAYHDQTAYGVGDMVAHRGSSWICVRECTGIAPPERPEDSSIYWDLMAKEGAVSSVNGQLPDENGEVTLDMTAHRLYLYETIGGAL